MNPVVNWLLARLEASFRFERQQREQTLCLYSSVLDRELGLV